MIPQVILSYEKSRGYFLKTLIAKSDHINLANYPLKTL